MRKICILIPLVAAAVTGAFGQGKVAKDKPEPSIDCTKAKAGNPICYAKEIQAMLEEHTETLAGLVKDSLYRYGQTAAKMDHDTRQQIDSDLALERSRRANQMATGLPGGRMAAAEWKSTLREYMLMDRDRMAALMLADLEHGTAAGFVASLEDDLHVDVAKAKKLADLVHLLAVPRDIGDELAQWMAYGKGAKDEYQKSSCADVSARSATATAALTAKKSELATAQGKVPPDLQAIQGLQSAVKSLDDQVKAFKEYTDEKKCTKK